MKKRGLYWLTNDLRVEDNITLDIANRECETLDWVYIVDPALFKGTNYYCKQMGEHRWRFTLQALSELANTLSNHNIQLHILQGNTYDELCSFYQSHSFDKCYVSDSSGFDEAALFDRIQHKINLTRIWQHTLLEKENTPFTKDSMPKHFTPFKQLVEKDLSVISKPVCSTIQKPAFVKGAGSTKETPLEVLKQKLNELPALNNEEEAWPEIKGGESQAQKHLHEYFSENLPHSYFETRNALDGWQNSTKFSFWLAIGNLSPRQVWQQLQTFHQRSEQTKSSYWIGFELLWREFFHWLMLKHQNKCFTFSGITGVKPKTTFSAERFQRWCHGTTPSGLVNACMNQLNHTGYMSNRGRQIVASYFVNELQLDWRYGASYFQQQLIDFDVAANWGNWQYIAGVGSDPRAGRHFNIAKQQQIYDPDNVFINKWQGNKNIGQLDSVNIADWPV